MPLDVVFFELRGRRCALPVAAVSEVSAMPSLTPVPHAPAAVRGIAPLHGQVLPVVDLGVWLGGGEVAPYRPLSDKLLLVEAALGEGTPVRAAFVVERVMRLGTIDETHGRAPPPGPPFVIATVLDVEGPALLIDAARAVEQVRTAVRAGGRG
jgi:chemotaxis signal transduction protein